MHGKFVFLLHPLDMEHVYREKPWAKWLPRRVVEFYMTKKKPFIASHITGIKSKTGDTAEGWFIIIPMTPDLMLKHDDIATQRIIEAGHIGEKLGATIMGLGAFTAIVGGAGVKAAEALDGIGVTTGNSYTAYTAHEALLMGAREIGLNPEDPNLTLAVVGGTGSIGRIVAKLLAPKVNGKMVIVGRNKEKAEKVASELRPLTNAEVLSSDDVKGIMRQADMAVTVSSAVDAIIGADDVKSGAVIVDVSRPRDVAEAVKDRDDVLVIDGGVVKIPGDVEFNFDFGFPPGTAFACMAETMMLALEGWSGDFSLTKELKEDQVLQTGQWAKKHGFELIWMRSFDLPVSEEKIKHMREIISRRVNSYG
ncbi:shikimate dehydrogenase [Zhurongbacter thermophilus]